MPNALRVSAASSLAMHALGLLASRPGVPQSCKTIATEFGVSEAHLSKVLQRLAKVGLVASVRGPKGGFSLTREPRSVMLLEVFEAIEGQIEPVQCLFPEPMCDGSDCALGHVIADVNRTFAKYLSEQNLEDIATAFESRNFNLVNIEGAEPDV